MTARQVCLGRHWYPYAYARTAVDGDGAPVKPFPHWLGELGRRAVADELKDDGRRRQDARDRGEGDEEMVAHGDPLGP